MQDSGKKANVFEVTVSLIVRNNLLMNIFVFRTYVFEYTNTTVLWMVIKREKLLTVNLTMILIEYLTPMLRMWRIGWARKNTGKWQMGLNTALKELKNRSVSVHNKCSQNPTVNLSALRNSCANTTCCSSQLIFTFLYAASNIQNGSQQFVCCIRLYFVYFLFSTQLHKQVSEIRGKVIK